MAEYKDFAIDMMKKSIRERLQEVEQTLGDLCGTGHDAFYSYLEGERDILKYMQQLSNLLLVKV